MALLNLGTCPPIDWSMSSPERAGRSEGDPAKGSETGFESWEFGADSVPGLVERGTQNVVFETGG